MTRSKNNRVPPRAAGTARAGYAGPREAFDSWLTRDLRRQYGELVSSPLPPDLEAAVKTLLTKDDERE